MPTEPHDAVPEHGSLVEPEYAPPRKGVRPGDCYFYHVMDVPGLGVVGEQWDLRETIDAYLGDYDFSGKRVLDVGTASGYLTFEIEKRGAEVVSVDLEHGDLWDIVPYAQTGFEESEVRASRGALLERLKNGYWLAHEALGSAARAYYGSVYDLPASLGEFDVVVLGAILLHLRDPFRALQSACRLSRGAAIVVDLTFTSNGPDLRFVPSADSMSPVDTWWMLSESAVSSMLRVLGFHRVTTSRARHRIRHDPGRDWVECTTYVGERR